MIRFLSILVISSCFVLEKIEATLAEQDENGGMWSQKKWVDDGKSVCVFYQAAVFRNALVVKFQHQKPWHSFAMDNNLRAKKALKGGSSLGEELPTTLKVSALEKDSDLPFFQSKPQNFSKPDLKWYSWGFAGEGHFAIQLSNQQHQRLRLKDLFQVEVDGQVCNGETCLPISVSIELTPKNFFSKTFPLETMEAVVAERLLEKLQDKGRKHSATNSKQVDWKTQLRDLATERSETFWQELAVYRGRSSSKGFESVDRVLLRGLLRDLKTVGFGSRETGLPYSDYVSKRSAELLGKLDSDRDGFIQKNEIATAIEGWIIERMEHRVLQDVDGDGRVSPREYSVSLRPGKNQTDGDGLTKRARQFFQRNDRNQNGWIDLDSEVLPGAVETVESDLDRLALILKIARRLKNSSSHSSEFNQQSFFQGLSFKVSSPQLWLGLQDLGRFSRRRGRRRPGDAPPQPKVYDLTIKRKTIAHRIFLLEEAMLKILKESL